LVVRSGRRIVVTAAGDRVVSAARGVLRAVRDLHLHAMERTFGGDLRLGANVTAMTSFVPEIMAAIAPRYPSLNIEAIPGDSGDIYAQVLSGDLDAAILVKPDFPVAKNCRFTLLRKEPLVVIAPALLPGSNPLDLLRTQPFIRLSPGNVGGRLADRYLRRMGIRPETRFELTSLAAIAVAVDRGLGVALVPDWRPPWPGGISLRKLPVPRGDGDRHIGLLWMHGAVREPLIAIVREAAVSCEAALSRSGDRRRKRQP
ncbi:MAG: LysR substrate-binding domain-containing protein, partial [Hyphomicrobiaceae bacterium]